MVLDTFPDMTTEMVHGEKFLLERTIETMESERRCVHPVHGHAFRQVNLFTSLFSGTAMKKCEGCQGRLRNILSLERDDVHQQVVKCVTCGVVAHRHCALSRTTPWQGSPCHSPEPTVHKKQQRRKSAQNDLTTLQPAFAAVAAVSGCYYVKERPFDLPEVNSKPTKVLDDEDPTVTNELPVAAPVRPPKSLVPFLSATSLLNSARKLKVGETTPMQNENDDPDNEPEEPQSSMTTDAPADPDSDQVVVAEDSHSSLPEQNMKWTPEGPPPHWAFPAPSSGTDVKENSSENSAKDSSPTLNFVNHSITSVSRAFQDSFNTQLLRRLSFESDYKKPETSSIVDAPLEGRIGKDQSTVALLAEGDGTKEVLTTGSTDDNSNDNGGQESNSPFNFVQHSFVTVSRVLQENILANFQRKPDTEQDNKPDSETEASSKQDSSLLATTHTTQEEKLEVVGTTDTTQEEKLNADVKGVEQIPQKSSNPLSRLATDTFEAVKSTSDKASKLGFATVAGGIAGGVAGLCIAGPAGAVIGAKCAQTAGVLGVLLEGSVQIGVFVAGVAAAKYTAQQIQQMEEKRFLTIGEAGSQHKVLLVRPNVVVDPVWGDVCDNARKSAPPQKSGGPHFLSFKIFPVTEEKKNAARYRRDLDIVQTGEEEIPTADKILLLASRILNDKSSLPGHVYRCLIKEFKDRCQKETTPVSNNKESDPISCETLKDAEKAVPITAVMCARRRDAHAVVKYLTTTLIDVRPEFASSRSITELTAVAVEGLVFGELYDAVFDEIVREEVAADKHLEEKIKVFGNRLSNGADHVPECLSHLSQPAIQTLQLLPQAHSPVDKLRICVHFLDCISQHFTALSSSSPDNHMGADSLLKMACQHIVAAKVPNLNAEIAFLEEFARDEQLLRGKEGYALVTLQASTHFLNLSSDLYSDIFADAGEVMEAT